MVRGLKGAGLGHEPRLRNNETRDFYGIISKSKDYEIYHFEILVHQSGLFKVINKNKVNFPFFGPYTSFVREIPPLG